MGKLKLSLIGVVATISLMACLVIRGHAEAERHEKEEAFRQRESQLTELAAENRHLSYLMRQVKDSPTDEPLSELQKLRNEAEALRKKTNELIMLRKQNAQYPNSPAISGQEVFPPAYDEHMHRANASDALHFVTACLYYAWDHDKQVPSNFEQVTPYLRKENLFLTGTNEFDFVYQGSLDELTNIPLGDVALIRGRQVWRGPDGKTMRVYGMAEGFSQTVGSDDNFLSWEAEHIIPPPTAR